MKLDEDLLRERVQKLIHIEGLSQREFAEKIGRNPSNLSQLLLGNRHIPQSLMTEILSAYPTIRKEWLILGEGEMYINDSDIYQKIVSDTKPRLPMNVSGSCIASYLDGTKRLMCDERPVIKQFPDYDCTIVLKNDTMSPRYERGDEIALRRVFLADYGHNNTIDTKSIEWGHEYVVDTKSGGPKFKLLYEKGNYYLLRSYNSEKYPDFLVPKSDVCAIYRVVGMIRV